MHVGYTMHNQKMSFEFFDCFNPNLKLMVRCNFVQFIMSKEKIISCNFRSQGRSYHGRCVGDNICCERDI